MKKTFSLLIVITLVLCTACSGSTLQNVGRELEDTISSVTNADNKYVQMVKNGYRSDDPSLSYDKAFSAYFGTPRWSYFQSEEGKDVVEFTGDCMYMDVQVKARIQFVVDEENGTFEAATLSFNEVPQNMIILAALITSVFEADEESSDPPAASSAVPSVPTEQSVPAERTVPAAESLTAADALALAQAWLDMHPISAPDILKREYDDENVNGEEFYRFFHIKPDMYWFSILVHKDTGKLFSMLIEDGMDPGPPIIEPLDAYYDKYFNYPATYLAATEELYQAIIDGRIWIGMNIFWENGTVTAFEYDAYNDFWYMYGRTGDNREVDPSFAFNRNALEIRFPTTSRVYYLYDDYTGVFGDEYFWWSFILN